MKHAFWLTGLLLAMAALGPTPAGADTGSVVWFELLTEDAEAARTFYGELLGWQAEPARARAVVLRDDGRRIGGIAEITDQMPEVTESVWLVGIEMPRLERALEAAVEAGGTVLREITEVPGQGRWAVIRDPQGAEVVLVDPVVELGGGTPDHGSFVWAELWTDDVDAASAFYATVLGYDSAATDRGSRPYTVMSAGGEARAGVVRLPEGDLEPAWAAYVRVDDLAAALVRVESLGGRVALAPREDFGDGRIALIADPTGAVLFLVEPPEKAPENR